jgi:hypothetical protein
VKLDKDKVVRKLKGNSDAARHKEKLAGISKRMATGQEPARCVLFGCDLFLTWQMTLKILADKRTTLARARCMRNPAAAGASSQLAAAGARGRALTGCVLEGLRAVQAKVGIQQGGAAAKAAAEEAAEEEEVAEEAAAEEAKGAEINIAARTRFRSAACGKFTKADLKLG